MQPSEPARRIPTSCPFHSARLQTRPVMAEPSDSKSYNKPAAPEPSPRRATNSSASHGGRTLSQKMLHTTGTAGDKLKKLFRTSSSGNSIDGGPAHPLTISVSTSDITTSQQQLVMMKKHSNTPKTGRDNGAVSPEPVPVEEQSGGSGDRHLSSTNVTSNEDDAAVEHQESIRNVVKPTTAVAAVRSSPCLIKAASIDHLSSTSSFGGGGGSMPVGGKQQLNLNASLGFWSSPARRTTRPFELQEIKRKLTVEGPGRSTSGNIITAKSPSSELHIHGTSTGGAGDGSQYQQSPAAAAAAATVDNNTAAALASLSSLLSASAVPNGRTLPQYPTPPQVPPFSSSSSSIAAARRLRYYAGGSSDDVDDSTTSSSTSSTGLVSQTPATVAARRSMLTMRSRTPGPAVHVPHYSAMYHPASVPHLPLNSDHDSVKVLNTGNTGDGYVYLNQYKLSNETLGHGTYSIVKLAYNTEDNVNYAMKILSKKKLMKKHRLTRKSGDPMQEAHREIAILKKLNHPNIIRLVEVLDDPLEDSLYMVFELLERGEVLVIPTDHPLHESTVRRLFRDLVLGVEYLHYNGILHRDLKPSNLLLDDNGRLKIADFGLSHMFEGKDDLLSGTVGTPAFHAPEILTSATANTVRIAGGSSPASRSGSLSRAGSDSDGERMMSRRVLCSGVAMDIWSMGITLYSLVFGEVPFRDQFIVGLYNEIKSSPPLFPPDIVISDQLQDLILRLLEKDPERRITLSELRWHPWITQGGSDPLTPCVEDNCKVQIQVTEEDILSSVRSIPHLDTLILIKAMLKRGSFHHPFKNNEDNRKGSLDSNLPVKPAST